MSNPIRSFIRTFAFLRKEIIQIFRQPRLIVTLVLGPFLILLLFGIGYRNEGRLLRTLFVAAKNDPIQEQIRQYAPRLKSNLLFSGISNDAHEAAERLRHGDVDLVILAPSKAAETLSNNRQAIFALYHNEIDPYQSDYVRFTGELYVNKLNQWLFTSSMENQKSAVARIQADLKDAISLVRSFRIALEKNDPALAQQYEQQMHKKLEGITESIRSRIQLLSALDNDLARRGAQELDSRFTNLTRNLGSLNAVPVDRSKYPEQSKRGKELEDDLAFIQSRMNDLSKINVRVLTSPFASRAVPISRIQPNLSQYFTPSVIILLLQHLAVTFASLSLVREFTTGRTELYRISPVRTGELLLGKYAGYMIISYFVAAALTALLIYALHMPMLGSWMHYVYVISNILIASLGVGFAISLISKTEGQAIQYSLIFLLMSIFFTGFLLNLRMLWAPIRLISWTLPATYGIQLLQDVMLRGDGIRPLAFMILASVGAGLFVVTSLSLQRKWKRT